MLNNHYELFLTEYFFYRCALGRLVKDPRWIFDALGEIFITDREKTDKLFALTETPIVADVKTYADYLRYCRIKKYVALTTGDAPEDSDEIISVKGEALKLAAMLKIDGTYATESAAFRAISESAAAGSVAALRVLGFVQCTGLYADRDEKSGAKNLQKSAQWNSVEGILTALHFCADTRKVNINRLRTVTDGTVYRCLADAAESKYGCTSDSTVDESVMLIKAFRTGKLKPEVYSAQYARIIFSNVISARDKEHALFSAGEQAISEIADLPLKLAFTPFSGRVGAIDLIPVKREKENDRIQNILYNGDLLTRSAFRPLCICADSEFMRAQYVKALRSAFGGAHIEYIDVARLSEYDLQPTGKNVFVRGCDEHSVNVYFMSFVGDIPAGVMQEAAAFLQSRKRKRFCLVNPCVTIDLGKILPVCFCDKQNAKELKKYCDVVTIAGVTNAEKPALFDNIIDAKKRLYGMKSVDLDDTAAARLSGLSIDGAESAIDAALRLNRSKAETVITAALIDECAADGTRKNRYGFGGDSDEI